MQAGIKRDIILAPSLNSNCKATPAAPILGAIKVGCWAAALDKATAGPAVCLQAKVTRVPSGSEDPEPSRVTRTPSWTVWGRASLGGWPNVHIGDIDGHSIGGGSTIRRS